MIPGRRFLQIGCREQAKFFGLRLPRSFFYISTVPNSVRKICAMPALNSLFGISPLSKFGFICPSGHVEVLAQCIKKVDKIAIVGWRAGEKHFLEMLSKGLQSVFDVIATCGNYEAAKDALLNVANAGIRVNQGTAEPGGFTEFVLNRRIESFLK